ncbi:hypothetical protein [Nocardia macrotermitis]|uniref:Uncharacterized protein n=1 Tax=Nocardia macrotermitis TaxID=2585198 RepID=A0A7K0DA54_9NOCA|nr:hypothetical protein [Nocardia macrotermitis]MQY22212.1 hypothetical protein [Nocardia macrotermitis]
MTHTVLYDDGLVELDQEGITLRRYYFPWAGSKRIPYTDIQKAEDHVMGAWTGKGRLWGSGDLRHWAPLDLHRPRKDTAIILDLGKFVRPVFSPDDPARVLALLRQYANR